MFVPSVGRATVPAEYGESPTPEYGRHGGRPYLLALFRPAAEPNPEPLNLEPINRFIAGLLLQSERFFCRSIDSSAA